MSDKSSRAGAASCCDLMPTYVLPLQDEELEHMAWQLDKRSHEGASGSNGHAGSSRQKAARHRLVFHDRSSKQGQQGRHRQHKQHLHISRTHGRSLDSDVSSSNSSSSDESSGVPCSSGSSSVAMDSQVQAAFSELPLSAEGEQQFYCLQLSHSSAAQDLQKAQERMARHMQQVRQFFSHMIGGGGACPGAWPCTLAAEFAQPPRHLRQSPVRQSCKTIMVRCYG